MNETKELQFYLAPSPGAKPEFLATVKPVDPSTGAIRAWNELCIKTGPSETVVLEDYTRDSWSWKPQQPEISFNVPLTSTDGRNKIPGFIKYLKERQKSAYGRVGVTTYVVVVSYVQSTKSDRPNQMDCRLYPDITKVPNCTIRQRQNEKKGQKQTASISQPSRSSDAHNSAGVTAATKKSGLLSSLVGAQQRTNMHLAVSNSKTQVRTLTSQELEPIQGKSQKAGEKLSETILSKNEAKHVDEVECEDHEPDELRTAQEVFAEFRQFCQDQMLDFDMANEQILKIPITLSEYTVDLLPDEKPKVTMELLKYMIYEACEEVNEEWIPYKEPSEFIDEAVIVIYKEGAAPPEVLEDLNRGELPDEVIGQQRAIAEARQRQASQAEARQKQAAEQVIHNRLKQKRKYDATNDDVHDVDDDVAALNQNKRDRRTMEAYQRDKERGRAK